MKRTKTKPWKAKFIDRYLKAILIVFVLAFSISTLKAQYEFGACYTAWTPGEYVQGDQVSHNSKNFQASYWTAGEPGVDAAWALIEPCGDGGLGADYTGPQRVIGYLPTWGNYDLSTQIEVSGVTHINIAFLLFKQNNNNYLSSDFASVEFAPFHYAKVDSMLFETGLLANAHSQGVKVQAAIGGATDYAFLWLMEKYYNNDAMMESIADLIVSYVNEKGLDGVDLDMECWWPDASIAGTTELGGRIRGDAWGGTDAGPHPAGLGLTFLAQKLRAKMPNKVISTAVFGTSYYGNNYDDAMYQYMDWIGLMTYDFTGSWNTSPKGPHSALHKIAPGTYEGQTDANPVYSAEDALEYWMGMATPAWNHDGGFAVPKAKLAIGVPFYGYDLSTRKPDNANGFLFVPYKDIISEYPNAPTSYDPKDPYNAGGFIGSDGKLLYYNTPKAAKEKIEYTQNYGHQGVIIWELSQDVPYSNDASILKAINDALGNVIVTNPSPTVNITAPTDGESIELGTTISIAANASDNGSVSSVRFYVNGSQVGEDNTSPYSFNWTASSTGDYTITAQATDNEGAIGTSSAVSISIFDDSAVLTSMTISPTNATISEGQTQQFSVIGYDQNNNQMSVSPTWSSTGSISTSGLFSGNLVGSYTVTATSGTISASTSISVESVIIVPTGDKQVVGYITNWDAWKSTSAGVPSAGALTHLNIDYSKYTILNYSFFGVAVDGSLHSGDLRNKNIYQDGVVQEPGDLFFTDIYSSWDLYLLFGELEAIQYINQDVVDRATAQGFDVQLNGTTWSHPGWGIYNKALPLPLHKEGGAPGLLEKAHANGVKVMASIGGWSMCKHYHEMAADPVKRQRFLDNCVNLMNAGFDGIDLDWEYPGPWEGMNFTGTQADYANFATLVQEIRNTIGPDKLITAAFSASPTKLADFDWAALSSTMDYFNIMTYDMNGGFSDIAGHNAPVYEYPGAEQPTFNWQSALNALDSYGAPRNKINFGIPFYGRGVICDGTADLNVATVKRQVTIQPDGPVSTSADYTNWPQDVYDGTPNYFFIKQKTGLGTTNGWTRHWDDNAKVPYLTNGQYFLSYDDLESIEYKAQYIVDNQLAGTIVWTVYGDLEFGGTVTSYGTKLKEWSSMSHELIDKVADVFENSDPCTPTTIYPYILVNDGEWQSSSSASVDAGSTVVLGPQPLTGGSWSWTGPNSFASTAREITLSSITTVQSGSYIATYTNAAGCISTQSFAISVNGAELQAPIASITSPANGATYTAPAAVTLTASASDADGNVTKVDYYNNGSYIGTATSSPYTYTYNVGAGNYSITAVATDNDNLTGTSSSVGFTVTSITPPGDMRIVGYMPSWQGNAADIQYDKLTHIIYAFVQPNASGDGSVDAVPSASKLQDIVSRAHSAGVKVMIAVGGWSDLNNPGFDGLSATAAGRTTFANNMLALCNQYNLDGVDIDWEYPTGHVDNYALMMQELANVLQPAGKELSAAVPGGSYYGDAINIAALNAMDFVNVMAYDGDAGAGHSPYSFAVSALDYYSGKGVSNDKLVLGVPFYARPSWTTFASLVAAGADPNADYYNGDYYNGLVTIRQKSELALNYGGVMMWELSQDATGANSLLSAIYETIDGGSTTLTASAGGSYSAETNTSISFNGSASGGTAPYSYSWNFGDGAIATGANPTHSYTTEATYTVTLTVTDAASEVASSTTSAIIEDIIATDCWTPWVPGAYNGADQVSYNGVNYQAKWWTNGVPGEDDVWENMGECGELTIPVTGVSISSTSVNLEAGQTQQLSATIAPSNATNKAVTWTSNNSSIASVSSTGLITAQNTGSATITVTSEDGSYTATSNVTVSIIPVGEDITDLGGVISAQYDDSPSAERYPNLIDNDVNTKYLTFNASAWVQYQAPGGYIVTSYTISSANDAAERDPLSWTLEGSNDGSNWSALDSQSGIDFPNRFQTLSFEFSNAASYSYYRLSMNNNSGTILQLAEIELWGTPGTTIVPVTGVTVTPTNLSIDEGQSQQLTATVLPTNATNQNISWSTANSSIASVSSTGLVTAVTAGTTSISVTTVDGGFIATSAITVNEVIVVGTCDGLQDYPEGLGSYTEGQQVANNGEIYEAKPYPFIGWANMDNPAYEPGVGSAWTDAWIYVGPCGGTTTPTAPAAPSSLSANALSSSSISLSWNDNSDNESSFSVERSTDGSSWTSIASLAANITSYSSTGLSELSTYYYRVIASNSVGNSAYSNTASATTLEGGVISGNLPARIMSGYWHSWNSGVPFIKLRDVDSHWDVINISFAEPVVAGSTDGQMQFVIGGLTADYTITDFKADVKSLQAQGKKIVLSIGGYEGFFSLTSAGAVTTFVNAIKSFVDEYGFDGIDIDLEQSSIEFNSGADPDFKNPSSPKVVNMIQAIKDIVNSYDDDFILSFAPETFYFQMGHTYYGGLNQYVDTRSGVYIPVIYALGDKVTYVQAQLYNSGSMQGNDGNYYDMGTIDGIIAMCEMAINGFTVNGNASYFYPGLRPDQVVIAVPASQSAAGSGQISNANLQQAFSTLAQSYPTLRGIMSWSINWDAYQNNNEFVISNRTFLDGYKSADEEIIENNGVFSQLTIYPNPVNDYLTIEGAPENSLVEIYNLMGQKMGESRAQTIDVSFLNDGNYLLRITYEGNISQEIFIKE